jgi:hypothetical protein
MVSLLEITTLGHVFVVFAVDIFVHTSVATFGHHAEVLESNIIMSS